MDFTISTYRRLLRSFLDGGYQIVPVQVYLEKDCQGKVIVLRHDVDELPRNALKMAEAEHALGICATYYFRRVPKSDHPEVISRIASMGHEIGYHYEDLSKTEGEMERALESFKTNLEYFRQFYPVKTVCMHGSSSSRFDNKEIWSHVHLTDFGLIGEPYISFDFDKVFYLTDTGYAWDGGKYAVRDKVGNTFCLSYHSTDDVIQAVRRGTFPSQVLILAHTLWTDAPGQWCFLHLREFFRNRVKLLARRSRLVSNLYSKLVKFYWK